jgi:glycosyltransferase involved in cell wall biosynthesis
MRYAASRDGGPAVTSPQDSKQEGLREHADSPEFVELAQTDGDRVLGITIIIPTYNRCLILSKTLEGLCKQTTPEYIREVIIINDGSTDSTREVVEEFSARLPIKYHELAHDNMIAAPAWGLGARGSGASIRGGNGKVSAARNLGLREATSSIVLFLDDDVIPGSQLVSEHSRFHLERDELSSVLLGYVAWHPELLVTPFMRWYGEFGALFGYSLLKDNQVNDARYLYSCNLSFKAEFLRRHGGFDEALPTLEDHELGYRLSKHGMKMYFRRTAVGYHYQTFTFDQACRRLERLSVHLVEFLQTDAGREMKRRRSTLPYRLVDAIVKVVVPLLVPFRFLLDSDVRLPNAFYRMFYWYYGTQRAFWLRARAKELPPQMER